MDQLEGTLTTRSAASMPRCSIWPRGSKRRSIFPTRDSTSSRATTRARNSRACSEALDALAEDGRAGRVVREGRLVVIVGRPNAGKSSLFNALVGAARAIVTEIPGTTRDLLTERVDIDGLPITLVDTAGLRDARDAIEAEGVRRARQAQEVAALSLVVVDASTPLSDDDRRLVSEAAAPLWSS